MGTLNTQGIEHAQVITGHIGKAVWRAHRQVQPMAQTGHRDIGHARSIETLAQPDVAVVKPHDAKPAPGQGLHQGLWPGDELHAQPHDQQRHRPVSRSLVIDLDTQAVGLNLHGGVSGLARCAPLVARETGAPYTSGPRARAWAGRAAPPRWGRPPSQIAQRFERGGRERSDAGGCP